MNIQPYIQSYQTRVLVGAVAAGTTTLNYYIDLRSGSTQSSPVLGAANVNPTITYSAPSSPLGTHDQLNESFDEVVVAVLFGAVTTGAVPTVALYTCDDIIGTNATLMDDVSYGSATLTGAALTGTTDDNKLMLLDVSRATGRFVNVRITRATQNIAINGVLAILGKPRRMPVTKDSTVYTQKVAFES